MWTVPWRPFGTLMQIRVTIGTWRSVNKKSIFVSQLYFFFFFQVQKIKKNDSFLFSETEWNVPPEKAHRADVIHNSNYRDENATVDQVDHCCVCVCLGSFNIIFLWFHSNFSSSLRGLCRGGGGLTCRGWQWQQITHQQSTSYEFVGFFSLCTV